MANDTFPGSAFHPAYGNHVTSAPSQATVDVSGADITGEEAHYSGGNNTGADDAATKGGLPHPAPKPLAQAGLEASYDPLELLDAIVSLSNIVDECNRRLTLGEDESIKRRMRGPLRGFSEFDANGVATVVLGPVPTQEIWLIDRYIISSDNGEVTDTLLCKVYDGGIGDATSMIDLTTLGNGNVSDNSQPVLLMPNNSLTFQWTGGTEGVMVYARANFRSIAVNAQFAKGNNNVI